MSVLVTSTKFSSLDDGALMVMLPLLAHGIGGASGVAAVFAARSLPWVIFAVPIGFATDHFDRTQLMKSAAAVRTLTVTFLLGALILDFSNIYVLFFVTLLLATCGSASEVSRQALVSHYIDAPSDLLDANARIAQVTQMYGAFLGPLAGGVLFAGGSTNGFTAILILSIVTTIFTYRVPRQNSTPSKASPEAPGTALSWNNLLLGFRLLVADRQLSYLAAFSFLVSTVWLVWDTTFTAFALDPSGLGLTSYTFSMLIALSACGAYGASRITGRLDRAVGLRWALFIALMGWAIWFAIPGITVNLIFIAASLLIGGGAGIVWNSLSITARQIVTPHHVLGRVTAAYRAITRGGRTLGALLGGFVASTASHQLIFFCCALTIVGIAAALLVFLKSLPVNDKREVS